MGHQRILVALDRSPQSQHIFEEAVAIAKHNGATLMLFHCLPIESPTLTPYTAFYSEEMTNFSLLIREELDQEAANVRQWLADYGKVATEQGVPTEWDWKIGEPGRWIRDLAHTWEADLVVIGRRGLRGLAEIFLGSVSNYIVHHVRCSVLVIQDQT